MVSLRSIVHSLLAEAQIDPARESPALALALHSRTPLVSAEELLTAWLEPAYEAIANSAYAEGIKAGQRLTAADGDQ